MTKRQSSVLAGDSGNGSRQLPWGGAVVLVFQLWGHLQVGTVESAVSVWSWIQNFMIFTIFCIHFQSEIGLFI
jgi:hypothetical protein